MSEHATVDDSERIQKLLDPLLEPVRLGSMALPNRFAMAPMTRNMSPGGVSNAENIDYYRARATGGTGLIITEGTYVDDPAAGPNTNVPRLGNPVSDAGWRQVVEAVHAAGSAIIPQLWHLGASRGNTPDFNPEVPSRSPSGVNGSGEAIGEAMTAESLDTVIEAFVTAARSTKAVGFDGLELHGAHGYLLDQFFWAATNRRSDAFGGSLSARASFPAEVVRAVRDEVGPDFPIVYRYSQWKGGHYDATIAESPAELAVVLAPLVDAGVDVFHVSTRRHWLPGFAGSGRDADLGLAGWTKKLTGLPTIAVGSVGVDTVFGGSGSEHATDVVDRIVLLHDQFERGEFDVVALGRALLADPQWVAKTTTGRADEVVTYRR
jgi:2,4-dienoyl-CoA reductase-like NADH-dependent reductase (Old Yellow Enzyme family)